MTRRITVALAAAAALGVSAAAIGTAGAAAKKNQLQIVGGSRFIPGVAASDTQHFTPANLVVKSGALVTLLKPHEDRPAHDLLREEGVRAQELRRGCGGPAHGGAPRRPRATGRRP